MLTERFELRFSPELIKAIDAWRGRQADVPPRAAAIRRLIEAGLEASKKSKKKDWPMAKKKAADKPARVRLADAHAIGNAKAANDAAFLGWRKLPGRERTMMGRFSDGTVVFRRRGKNAWVFGEAA
jgi:hypothetical protein